MHHKFQTLKLQGIARIFKLSYISCIVGFIIFNEYNEETLNANTDYELQLACSLGQRNQVVCSVILQYYSVIHKAAGRRQERPQRPFPYSLLQGFSGIVPGKAGNSSAGGFVNSAVTVLFTKLLYGLPLYRMWSGGHSNRRLHSRLMGISGIVPGKIMERLGTVRPGTL